MSDKAPWVDIYPTKVWDRFVTQYWKGEIGYSTAKTTMGGGKLLEFKLGRLFSSDNWFLNKLGNTIKHYHSIPKAKVGTLSTREAQLREIAQLVAGYADEHKLTRKDMQKGESSSKHSLGYFLLKLGRRAQRKADYIKKLNEYYTVYNPKSGTGKHTHGGTAKGFRNPKELIEYLVRHGEKRSDGLLNLQPDVLLERMDPWHRNFEMSMSISSHGDLNAPKGEDILSHAVSAWLYAVGKKGEDTPLFIWLEGHPLCTEDDTQETSILREKDIKSVTYQNREMGAELFAHLLFLDPASSMAYSIADNLKKPFDTTDAPQESKMPQGYAYIWTQDNLLLCAPHRGGSFHHSSLDRGRKVKCAGMIRFIRGKATAVNNDSGHYKPGTEYLRNFVYFLFDNGVLDVAQLNIYDSSTKEAYTFTTFLTNKLRT
jgi:hypothetical protein